MHPIAYIVNKIPLLLQGLLFITGNDWGHHILNRGQYFRKDFLPKTKLGPGGPGSFTSVTRMKIFPILLLFSILLPLMTMDSKMYNNSGSWAVQSRQKSFDIPGYLNQALWLRLSGVSKSLGSSDGGIFSTRAVLLRLHKWSCFTLPSITDSRLVQLRTLELKKKSIGFFLEKNFLAV